MKRFLTMMLVVCGLSLVMESKAANYTMNDAELTAAFDAAETVSTFADADADAMPVAAPQKGGSSVGKSKGVAAGLAFFIGGLGIHRHYLGTSGAMWAVYCFTCGGIGGLVPTVDFFVLLLADDISPYVNNEDFIMW